jgi:OmpA-OmpF porin, OOP family
MKKLLLTIAVLTTLSLATNAQTRDLPFAAGIWGGATQYNGDLGQGIYDTDQATYGHIGISASWYITSRWDFSLNGTYGQIGYIENDFRQFRGDQLQLNGHFRFNIFNSDEHRLIPYLHGGIGVAYYENYTIKPGTDVFVPFGAGIRFKVSNRINLHIQETFAYSNNDKRDGEIHDNNDGFAMHSLGLTYSFATGKDADRDGVSDKRDKCPNTPTGVKVDANGCPLDRDGDGIADYVDACPDVKGQASAKGCPDKDGDGIVDAEDACPTVFGIIALKGCPDKDGDGITDANDACPDLKGLASFKGCPDTDGDGVIDPDDMCVTVKGLASLKGCPDADGDGITDADDKCPTVAGIAANKGCPEVKEEVKKLFTQALAGIQFETGKDVIKKSSYGILDNVVKVMNENPSYLLGIEGHTDNTGDKGSNLTLSQKRADAVKNYLTSKGVNASRLTARGFGDTVPVADNKTADGRSKNRRVEFKVSF